MSARTGTITVKPSIAFVLAVDGIIIVCACLAALAAWVLRLGAAAIWALTSV